MKKVLTFMLLAAALSTAVAQTANDPVIFEVGGKPIYKSQFMKDFLQSIGKDPSAAPTACTYEKRKALEEYAQLYVNFRAKLADAYALGYDTLPALRKELKTYRDELATSYLIDSTTLKELLQEAYERSQYALHAAHILVPCGEAASAQDTEAAYNHAMELSLRARNGEDFYTLAQEEMRTQRMNSKDPLVRKRAEEDNPIEGDLGCFTVFDMIYPFESAVYAMKPGEVSQPVRTKYGYHVIKLFERNHYYGKANVAHIWVSNKAINPEKMINGAYRQLAEGDPFATVAKNYSSDRGSGAQGIDLGEMPCNQLPPEYVSTIASGMQVGDFSKPFKTRYGWHIIKLISKEECPPFESMVPYLKSRMTVGERSKRPQRIFAEQCKRIYGFEDYTKVKTSKKKNAPYAASLAAIRAVVTDTIFSAKFNYDSNQITDMRPLFRIGETNYNSRDFARYLSKHKKVWPISDLDIFVAERYKDFMEYELIKYADNRLEQDNPEFRDLMAEYRHGLMIFTYNDKFVWSRAIKDTAGFAAFYAEAMPKHDINDSAQAPYFWNERARVYTFSIFDSACLAPEKAISILQKKMSDAPGGEALRDALMKKVRTKKCKADNPVIVRFDLVERGSQDILRDGEWHTGIYGRPHRKGYDLVLVEKVHEPEPKALHEARGYYLNDYQNYLDQKVCSQLREKYNVKVHQEVIDEITY